MSWITERKEAMRFYKNLAERQAQDRAKFIKRHHREWTAANGRTMKATNHHQRRGCCYTLTTITPPFHSVGIDDGWATGEYGEKMTKQEMEETAKLWLEHVTKENEA